MPTSLFEELLNIQKWSDLHSGHVHVVQMYQALFSSSVKTLGSELDMCHTPATLVVCGLLASPVFARH